MRTLLLIILSLVYLSTNGQTFEKKGRFVSNPLSDTIVTVFIGSDTTGGGGIGLISNSDTSYVYATGDCLTILADTIRLDGYINLPATITMDSLTSNYINYPATPRVPTSAGVTNTGSIYRDTSNVVAVDRCLPWTCNDSLDVILTDTTANVGIGTTSPAYNLHVVGTYKQVYLHDTLSNEVGADYIFRGIAGVDPISLFTFNDAGITGNKVNNSVFQTGLTGGATNNYILAYSGVLTSGTGEFNSNWVFGSDVSALGFTGSIGSNTLKTAATFIADSTSGTISNNEHSGITTVVDLTNYSGDYSGNYGTVLAESKSSSGNLLGNFFYHRPEIYNNNSLISINANTLETGAILYSNNADTGSISKNKFNFTVQVDANNTQGNIEYSVFRGGNDDTYSPYIYAKRDFGKYITGSEFRTGADSLFLDPAKSYDRVWYTDQSIGIDTTYPMAKLHNAGTTILEDSLTISDGTEAEGYVLTSDANGHATWQDNTAWGEMGFGDSTSTQALTQNVWHVVTNGNEDLWASAVVDTHAVTYSNDSLIIAKAGTYSVHAQLSVDGSILSIIRLGIYINGALACTCTGYQELTNNTVVQLNYINIDQLNEGDVLQVVITNTANNDDVDAIGGKLAIHKL